MHILHLLGSADDGFVRVFLLGPVSGMSPTLYAHLFSCLSCASCFRVCLPFSRFPFFHIPSLGETGKES